jgi:hydrogenase/urease accessory protein HupE
MNRVVLIIALFLWSCATCVAHEVRPAYLELRQTSPDVYSVFWKVPGLGENLRLALDVEMPPDSTTVTPPPRGFFVNNAFIKRWTVRRQGGLAGATIEVSGLDATLTDVLARIERMDGTVQIARLTPAQPSFIVEASPNTAQIAGTYLKLGVEHILTGYDHLLFLLALIVIVRTIRSLIATVTAFTVAHSITLALATLAVVRLPQPPIEAAIALSIILVAAEATRMWRRDDSLTIRYPWLVAFVFGLLHGFGFAGALLEIGLPATDVPLALFTFNIGVETGQLVFIGTVFLFVRMLRTLNLSSLARQFAQPLMTYGIGAVSSYWLLDRLAGFGL